MAFYSNSTQGTVTYSADGYQQKILANDGSSLSSNTLATQSDLSIALAGYERVMGKYTVWYDSDDTNELKFLVKTVAQSDGSTTVASTIYTQAIASVLESTSAATCAATALESSGTSSTNGAGVELEVDIGAATTGTLLTVDFNVLVTAATKSNLVFQARNTTGTGAGTHLLAGSNVVYKKW